MLTAKKEIQYGYRLLSGMIAEMSFFDDSAAKEMMTNILNESRKRYLILKNNQINTEGYRVTPSIKKVVKCHPLYSGELSETDGDTVVKFFIPMTYLYRKVLLNTYLPRSLIKEKLSTTKPYQKSDDLTEFFYKVNSKNIVPLIADIFDINKRSRASGEVSYTWITKKEYEYFIEAYKVKLSIVDVAEAHSMLPVEGRRAIPKVSAWESLSMSMHYSYERLLNDLCYPQTRSVNSFILSASVKVETIDTARSVIESFGDVDLLDLGDGHFSAKVPRESLSKVIQAAYANGVFVKPHDAGSNLDFYRSETAFDVMFEAIITGSIHKLHEINKKALKDH